MLALYEEIVRNAIVSRLRIVVLSGVGIFVIFHFLDRVLYPELITEFLIIRILTILFWLLLMGLSYLPALKKHAAWIADAVILAAGGSISVMIYLADGVSSSYYQGLNMTFLAAFVMNSFEIKHHIFTGAAILVFYGIAVWLNGVGSHTTDIVSNLFFMGGILFFVALFTRIFGKQHYTDYLKTQQIVEAERLKTEFFANVSHELRTPLTLILSPLESLMDGQYGPSTVKQSPIFETIHHNAVRLLQMVTGLLDFSKLEAGKIEVKREPTQVTAQTQSILEDFSPVMAQKGLHCSFESNDETMIVSMDQYLYERIVFNLLSNAVKFTDKGGSISVRLHFQGDRLKVSVTDTGIGISASDLKNLFQKFRQLEGSRTRRFEGTGLGLAMVKGFSNLLEGDVSIESEPGRGSTISAEFYAPAVKNAAGVVTPERKMRNPAFAQASNPWPIKEEVEEDFSENKPRVLIAEDNVDLAEHIASLLRGICTTQIVYDGQEALEKAIASPVDLILSDIMMPKRDGFSLCSEIKKRAETSRIPVILLTALTHRDALIKGWHAGADEYIFKPFHPRELVTRVKSMLMRVQARDRAEESERQMKLAMENAVEGIAIIDQKGQCLEANAPYAALLGYSAGEMQGKRWDAAIQEADRNLAKRAYAKMLEKGKADVILSGVRQDGMPFKMELVMVKNPQKTGSAIGHYAFIRDVSDTHYKEALAIKSEFVSILSHEMRTPLHVLREGVWSIQNGMMGPVDAAQKNILEMIHESAARLIRLAERTLNFQHLESGKVEPQITQGNINTVVQEVYNQMLPLSTHKEVSLKIELCDEIPQHPFDKDLITEVLLNLVENAMKFTNQGSIVIAVEKKEAFIQVSVKDTGIGIRAEDLTKIFRSFGQLEAGKIQAPRKGVGLGLAISKKIIDAHQGEIGVESVYQKGSIFSFILPVTFVAETIPA